MILNLICYIYKYYHLVVVTPKSKRPGIVRKRKLETGRNKEPSGRDDAYL